MHNALHDVRSLLLAVRQVRTEGVFDPLQCPAESCI
jgi:hypothetical protein